MWQGVSETGGARTILACLIVALVALKADAQGLLSTVRDDVRGTSSTSSPSESEKGDHDRGHGHDHHDDCCDDDDDNVFVAVCGEFLFYGLTSPFWGPPAVVEDDFTSAAYFPRFPYQRRPGYLMSEQWPDGVGVASSPIFGSDAPLDLPPVESWLTRPRRWGARVRTEYGDNFDGLERVGGHLLLSTSSRWGLDTEMSYLEESSPDGGEDHLWIGDCNVVYRFAQSERVQWRAGLGFNWLDDPADTNFGFNFTYGADFFPQQPWVLSATLDWGSLGRAELFRFRSTVGLLVFGMETYTGYEYQDIDNTQINSLVGGVRIWF